MCTGYTGRSVHVAEDEYRVSSNTRGAYSDSDGERPHDPRVRPAVRGGSDTYHGRPIHTEVRLEANATHRQVWRPLTAHRTTHTTRTTTDEPYIQRIDDPTNDPNVESRGDWQAGCQVSSGEGSRPIVSGWNVVNVSELLEGQHGLPPQQGGTQGNATGEWWSGTGWTEHADCT